MTNTYLPAAKINTARELLAARNWQDNDKTVYVQRAAVLALVIDWAQGRVEPVGRVASVIDDSHIGSGSSGYSLTTRINRILADLAEHAAEGNVLYLPLTEAGLDALTAWLEDQPMRDEPLPLGEVDTTLDMHPRQRAVLKDVAPADRYAVTAHARFLTNVSGGLFSGNLFYAVRDLKRAGSAEALLAQDRKDNEHLMARSASYRR